jgi:hypothetical protein
VPWVPEGSADEVIVRDTGATTIETETDVVCAGFAESTTAAVKVAVPTAVGVPEINPVAGARLRPPGRLPEATDQV